MLYRQTQATQLPWSILKRFEPRLADMERRAFRCRKLRGRRFWQVYEAIKRELECLVGWNVSHPLLCTSEAYDAAHRAILAAMEGD